MRFTLYVDYSLLQKKGEESLECKLQKLLENKVTHLKVDSVFLFEGKEFFELKRRVKNFYGFKSVYFTKPLFSSKKTIKKFARIFSKKYDLKFFEKYFFVAHGLDFSKNQKVFYLEKQIRKLGFKNVRFSVLKGKGNKNDLYKKLVNSGEIYSFRNVKIIPFFINFGNHVKKELFNLENSDSSVNFQSFFDSKARYLILSLMDKENPVLNAFIVENHTDVKKDELKII